MNNIVKGILLSAALIGVGTGGYFAYKKISDQNTQIATLQKENTQKDNEIIALNIELDKKQREINSLSEKLQTANKNLETLQAKVNTLEQDIQFRDENISTLSKQKKTLLTAVTEIDTKVTQSTDSVEIETLQERKIAILTQIDELNTQISQLNTEKQTLQAEITELKLVKTNLEKEIEQLKTEKQQLENEIEVLKTEKQQLENEISNLNNKVEDLNSAIDVLENSTGLEYMTTNKLLRFSSDFYLACSNNVFSLEDILSCKYFIPVPVSRGYSLSDYMFITKSFAKSFVESFSKYESLYISSTEYYKYTLKDTWDVAHYFLPQSFIHNASECEFKFYYNNKQCDISELLFDDDSKSFVVCFCIVNDTTVSIYFLDLLIFTGKYINSNGYYIDFDNKIIHFESLVQYGLSYLNYSSCSISDKNFASNGVLTMRFQYYSGAYERNIGFGFKLDSSTGNLIINGETYTKVTDETSET